MENFLGRYGVPDLLINSAGITYPARFEDLDTKIFHSMMDVNYFRKCPYDQNNHSRNAQTKNPGILYIFLLWQGF